MNQSGAFDLPWKVYQSLIYPWIHQHYDDYHYRKNKLKLKLFYLKFSNRWRQSMSFCHMQIRILARYQACHVINRLNIYHINRRLLIGSTRICYDAQNYLWTNQKLLIYEVNFKIMTSLVTCNISICFRKKSFDTIDNSAISQL